MGGGAVVEAIVFLLKPRDGWIKIVPNEVSTIQSLSKLRRAKRHQGKADQEPSSPREGWVGQAGLATSRGLFPFALSPLGL